MIQKEIQPHEMSIILQLMKSVSHSFVLKNRKKRKCKKKFDSKKQEMINKFQSFKGNCQEVQDLIREFDILSLLIWQKKAQKKQ